MYNLGNGGGGAEYGAALYLHKGSNVNVGAATLHWPPMAASSHRPFNQVNPFLENPYDDRSF